MNSRGILIAIEGIDGAGKTTQVSALSDALDRAGIPSTRSKEPTNGPWGAKIRRSASTGRLSLEEELTAFVNDRAEHVELVIKPALDAGHVVILDRYFYSTIAYQGARGADLETVTALMEKLFPIPDRVYVLDVDPLLGVHRITHSRHEKPNCFESRADLAKSRTIFQLMEKENIEEIDGAQSIQAIHERILRSFIDGPLKAKRCAKVYGCDDPFHCSYRRSDTCEWVRLSKQIMAAEPIVA